MFKKDETEEIKKQFLDDVSEHKIQILLNHGVYRHLHFSKPGTNSYYFELITGPGYLLYRGDMGTFVFERVRDMFMFFEPDDCEKLTINPGYWAEKIEATERDGGHKEFDREYFKEVIKEEAAEYTVSREMGEDDIRTFNQRVESQILYGLEDKDQRQAISDAMALYWNAKNPPFGDIYEHNFYKPTYRYLWACFAIVWGIQQYRKYLESK